jgi:hypothetical protein
MIRRIQHKRRIGFFLAILIVAMTANGCAVPSAVQSAPETSLPVAPSAPVKQELKVGDTVYFGSGNTMLTKDISDWHDMQYYVATQNGSALLGMEDAGRYFYVEAGCEGKVIEKSDAGAGEFWVRVLVESGEVKGKKGWALANSFS